MAIVKTYRFGNATVHIDDAYYRGISPDESRKRIQNMREVAGDIMYRQQLRELESTKNTESVG